MSSNNNSSTDIAGSDETVILASHNDNTTTTGSSPSTPSTSPYISKERPLTSWPPRHKSPSPTKGQKHDYVYHYHLPPPTAVSRSPSPGSKGPLPVAPDHSRPSSAISSSSERNPSKRKTKKYEFRYSLPPPDRKPERVKSKSKIRIPLFEGDSNANLERNSSLGFGVHHPHDWLAPDYEVINELNGNEDHTVIAYTNQGNSPIAKLFGKKGKNKMTTEATQQQDPSSKNPNRNGRDPQTEGQFLDVPENKNRKGKNKSGKNKANLDTFGEGDGRKPDKHMKGAKNATAKTQEQGAKPARGSKSRGTMAGDSAFELQDAEQSRNNDMTIHSAKLAVLKGKKNKNKQASYQPEMDTSKPNRNVRRSSSQSRSTSPRKVASNNNVRRSSSQSRSTSPASRNIERNTSGVSFRKKTSHESQHLENKKDSKKQRRATGRKLLDDQYFNLKQEDEYEQDESNMNTVFVEYEDYPPLAPNGRQLKRRPSSGPTIEDDNMISKSRYSLESSGRPDIYEENVKSPSGSFEESPSAFYQETQTASYERSNGDSLASSSTKRNSSEKASNTEMTGELDETAFKRTPNVTPRMPPQPPSEEVLMPPALTTPMQNMTTGMGGSNVHWSQQNQEGYSASTVACNDDDTKVVQAKLMEWFQTQRTSQCCCQKSNYRRPRRCCCSCSGGGGGGQQQACVMPCCCQRCRVYNYCFNVLNRHTLKPDKSLVGSNSRIRQQQSLNSANGAPSSNILNAGQGEKFDSLSKMNRSMRTLSGAKNWASPPDGYEDTQPPTRDPSQSQYSQYPLGSSSGARPFAGGKCPVEAMVNRWKSEYATSFIDFSDQIRTSSRHPDYDFGFGKGRRGGKENGCVGGCGQQGKQMRMSSCFDTTNRNGGGGNYGENLN